MAGSSSRTWERVYEFERVGLDNEFVPDALDESEGLEASGHLADFLMSLKTRGKISARDVCVIMFLMHKLVGINGK